MKAPTLQQAAAVDCQVAGSALRQHARMAVRGGNPVLGLLYRRLETAVCNMNRKMWASDTNDYISLELCPPGSAWQHFCLGLVASPPAGRCLQPEAHESWLKTLVP